MKVLAFHRMCLLTAIVLGLVFAWSNAVPKVTSGDLSCGGCYCRNLTDFQCSSVPGCSGTHDRCAMDSSSYLHKDDDCKPPDVAGTCDWTLEKYKDNCDWREDETCNQD